MSTRTVETPDLQPTTATSAKYSVERYCEDKAAFEAADLAVTDHQLALSGGGGGGSLQYRLYLLQELRAQDDSSLELLFPVTASIQVRFASASPRGDAEMEIRRLHQVALENRSIEEAEEVLANFEEEKAIK